MCLDSVISKVSVRRSKTEDGASALLFVHSFCCCFNDATEKLRCGHLGYFPPIFAVSMK